MDNKDARMKWWRDAKFGMFIHWGLYSIPAGFWRGEEVPGHGEWIMRNGKIPIPEYTRLAEEFNPVNFDPEGWVMLAKQAGMKYLAITAKHHDGFCLFKTACHKYNVVDATPFGRDVIGELAAACAKHGLKFCLYYSQSQDWYAEGGAGHWEEDGYHNWGDPQVSPEAFAVYLKKIVEPQLRELLTNYGPISIIWFDTPVVINAEQSQSLADLVHELQPDCLISGRVGNGKGDYNSLGDNQIPKCVLTGDWETPATLNDTWGFKVNDNNWKEADSLIFLLSKLMGKGANYLLNIGPDGKGDVPEASVKVLQEIGAWMEKYGEAVYESKSSPFMVDPAWGSITTRGNKLYLFVSEWAQKLPMMGLRNKVLGAYYLDKPEKKIEFVQENDGARGYNMLELSLPEKSDEKYVPVLVLELDGEADVDNFPMQQPGGKVEFFAIEGTLHKSAKNEKIKTNSAGYFEDWTDTESWAEWDFRLFEPGEYKVWLVTRGPNLELDLTEAKAGQEIEIGFGSQKMSATLKLDRRRTNVEARHCGEYESEIGTVKLTEPGDIHVVLRAIKIPEKAWGGLGLISIVLEPVE